MSPESEVRWHGKLAPLGQLATPVRVVECNAKSRPEYTDIPSHEYRDTPESLNVKIKILADLLRRSQKCVAYTGAGLSVSSGLADYATKAEESVNCRQIVDSRYMAKPNTGHKVLAELYHGGFVKRVFNQNHDGLLQKAGLPQHAVNEIHGAFFDPSNPGGFELRGDLVDDLYTWASETDLCLALGSSLSGLNADRLARTPAKKLAPRQGAFGLVIVNLQETQIDALCSLRIYEELDHVMHLLSKELQLQHQTTGLVAPKVAGTDQFSCLPYNARGSLDPTASTTLNLQPGAAIQVTAGNFAGCKGIIVGKNEEGHYLLKVEMVIEGDLVIKEDLLLGSWFMLEAASGSMAFLPIVQHKG